MTEKRKTPGPAAGKTGRKRAAPTIDLKATEVRPAQAAAQEPMKEQPAQASSDSVHAAAEPPRAEPGLTSTATVNKSDGETAGSAGSINTRTHLGLLLAAGVAGAAAMSAVLLGLWLTGQLPFRYSGSAATHARLMALEMQIQDMQKRPAQNGIAFDKQAIDAFNARVAKMEDTIKNIPKGPQTDPALVQRFDAADNAIKSLGIALAALNRRNDAAAADVAQAQQRAGAAEEAVTDLRAGLQDVSKTASAGASSADLALLQQRIAALEQSAKAVQAEIAKASSSDEAARLALSAAILRDAVLRGTSFAAEFAQAQSLGADARMLAPLAPFAASGVPSEKNLAQELGALLPAMLKAPGAPAGGFIERLQANAKQLVRVRPLDASAGDDAAAVLARIELAAARADIAAALSDLGKLSAAEQAPAQAWIAKAERRQAAIAAARQLAADTARSLGPR